MMTAQIGGHKTGKGAALWPPLLPREHGGWMMLIVPLVVGAAAGGPLTRWVLLTFVAAFFAYLARHPLVMIARARGRISDRAALAWLFVYGGIAGVCGLAVIGPGGYRWLAAFGLLAAVPLGANLFLAARRAEMSLAGELFGIAGLSLGAPAMYYVAAGSAQPQMAGLWLLSFLYFGGTVFYVRLKVRVHARQDAPQGYLQRLLIGRTAVIYHFGVLVLTAFLVTTGLVPLFAPLAYVPATCKAVQGVLAWQRPVSVKRIGVIEIIHSLSFALLVIIACYV